MDLTKEQKEIFSKIADIKQVILKNHFDISDLTEQLISTLPFKEGDIGDYSDWEMIDGKHYCPDCYEVEVIGGVYNVKAK